MLAQLRSMYDVDPTVTDDDLRESARLASTYDEVLLKHDIDAFGYFWWGERPLATQLRAQSAVAVSRLTSLGRPGVTEGDVKTAMGMKLLDLLGAGGMFVEFFAFDYDENFILMGHDGPSNINLAAGRPRLQHLDTHHGKSGEGLGIDFDMRTGPVTLLNWSQFDAGETFKLIYSIGEVVDGEILRIGNPNCRVRVERPLHEFMDAWCQQGPCHHIAMGLGDRSAEIEAFAEAMKFRSARV
jgi:L-arabinose isomerase